MNWEEYGLYEWRNRYYRIIKKSKRR
jgi:hypothetical protein